MPKALRRFALPAVALVLAAAGSGAVLAAPAEVAPAAGMRPAAVTPVSAGDRAVFVPVPQKRLLNTRTTSAITPTRPRAVKVAGVAGVPAGALAVVVNVAAYKPAKAGFLSVYPTGATRPAGIATVTFIVGQVTENVATVKVGAGGQVTVFASTTSHAIMDIAGYYVPHAHDDRYLPKAQTQARTAAGALTCPTGSLIQAVAADGATTCVQDATGVVQGAGAGLLLDNGVLSAEQGRSAANAFVCPPGSYLRAVAADGAPTCETDATGPVQSVGAGLLLDNGVLSAQQGRSAVNAFTCAAGQYLRAAAADGTPTCVADAAGPSYTAGFGLSINGTTISAQQGRSASGSFFCGQDSFLRAVAADGASTCAFDQRGPAYTAGPGLALTGTTFSLAEGATVRVGADGTAAANGAALRSAVAGITGATATKPYVVRLAAGRYALGTQQLTLPSYVSLVGAGREHTFLTGAVNEYEDGLIGLTGSSTVANLALANEPTSGGLGAYGVVANGGNGRVVDVAIRATHVDGQPMGIVSFNGGDLTVQNTTVFASGPTLVYGLAAFNAGTLRASLTDVTVTGPDARAAAAESGTLEFAYGSLSGSRAAHWNGGDMRVAYSKLTGTRTAGTVCIGAYDAAFAPVTC